MRKAVAAAFALAVLACGRAPPGVEVSVRAVFATATSVGCVRISTAAATRTVSQDFAAPSGTTSSFVLHQVPTGDVVIAGTAYEAPCTAVTTQHPSWVAGSVLQTLAPGVSANVSLSFHPNGEATLAVQFGGIAAAPADASCLRVAAVGATPTRERGVDPGGTGFSLSRVPPGGRLFFADPFP